MLNHLWKKKFDDKYTKLQNETSGTIEALKIENNDSRDKVNAFKEQLSTIRKEVSRTKKIAIENSISSNFNVQCSRKNNMKV